MNLTRRQEAGLALRLLWRDYRAGELTLLVAALVIAVSSLTTVDFFINRVQLALIQQSNQLLGADLTLISDRPFASEFAIEAQRRKLAVTTAVRFPSMALHGSEAALSDIKAVAPGYPLRGEVHLADRQFGAERIAQGPPPAGSAWVDERLFTQLNLEVGDTLSVGNLKLRVTALLTQEPDGDVGFLNSAPRLLMNTADIDASGLVQTGSRVRYRMYVAGDSAGIDAYRNWVAGRLGAGQRMQGVRDARPEIRSALERAERFLGLSALVSVVLSAVAIALAARRFLLRHLDSCAVMRCLGTPRMLILRLYLLHFLILGVIASVIGCLVGLGAQTVLAAWLGELVTVELPWPSALPAVLGLAAGVLLLLGFGLPPLLSLGQVPVLRVLRRELGLPHGVGAIGYLLGLGVICGLVLWKASDLRLGAYVLGGFIAAAAGSTLIMFALLRLLARWRTTGHVSWRYGIANLRRRSLGNTIQVVALGLGIMALLTLTLIRGDLLQSWQATLKPDTPNRFLINIQPDQVEPLTTFLAARGMPQPTLFPMVRGRLVAVNERAIAPADYPDERARRLVDREFNLSWADQPAPGNTILAGRWWAPQAADSAQLSMEEGIAQTLGLKLGDLLTYDVAGSRFTAAITSLRKVDWDSFRVNFFAITPTALLRDYPASYITSFHIPQGQAATLNALVREFPNIVMIDVAQLMLQVQKLMDQVARAVQFVFLFTLAAGLVVLYAALASTRDEREYEAAIMRTLGASRRQISTTQFAEFVLMGALAGLLAAAGATGLGYALAIKVLHVPYFGNPWIWLIGVGSGAVGIALAGMLGTRRVLAAAPLESLRRAA